MKLVNAGYLNYIGWTYPSMVLTRSTTSNTFRIPSWFISPRHTSQPLPSTQFTRDTTSKIKEDIENKITEEQIQIFKELKNNLYNSELRERIEIISKISAIDYKIRIQITKDEFESKFDEHSKPISEPMPDIEKKFENDIRADVFFETIFDNEMVDLLNQLNNFKPIVYANFTKPKNEKHSQTKRKSIPQDVKDKVWNRDGGECVECSSSENLEFDHIIPVAKGGSNTYRNLQLLCEPCNWYKKDNIG